MKWTRQVKGVEVEGRNRRGYDSCIGGGLFSGRYREASGP